MLIVKGKSNGKGGEVSHVIWEKYEWCKCNKNVRTILFIDIFQLRLVNIFNKKVNSNVKKEKISNVIKKKRKYKCNLFLSLFSLSLVSAVPC